MSTRFILYLSTALPPVALASVAAGHYLVGKEADPNPDSMLWVEVARGDKENLVAYVVNRKPYPAGETEGSRRGWIESECAKLDPPVTPEPEPKAEVKKAYPNLGLTDRPTPQVEAWYTIATKTRTVETIAGAPLVDASAGVARGLALIPSGVFVLIALAIWLAGAGVNPDGEQLFPGGWMIFPLLGGAMCGGIGILFLGFTATGRWLWFFRKT